MKEKRLKSKKKFTAKRDSNPQFLFHEASTRPLCNYHCPILQQGKTYKVEFYQNLNFKKCLFLFDLIVSIENLFSRQLTNLKVLAKPKRVGLNPARSKAFSIFLPLSLKCPRTGPSWRSKITDCPFQKIYTPSCSARVSTDKKENFISEFPE